MSLKVEVGFFGRTHRESRETAYRNLRALLARSASRRGRVGFDGCSRVARCRGGDAIGLRVAMGPRGRDSVHNASHPA